MIKLLLEETELQLYGHEAHDYFNRTPIDCCRFAFRDDFLALTITVSTAEGEDKMSGKGLEGVYVPDDDDGIPPVRGNTGGSTGGSTTGSLSGPIGNGRR